MAKISARGDSVRFEWRDPNGGDYVFTMQGRLLHRRKGEPYKLVKKYGPLPEASALPASLIGRLRKAMKRAGLPEEGP